MYSSCSFIYVLVLSQLSWDPARWHLLDFIHKIRALFHVISFFPIYYWLFNATFGSWFGWCAPDRCFYMGSNKVYIFVIWRMSFRCLLMNIKLVSNLIIYITIGKRGQVISWCLMCFFFVFFVFFVFLNYLSEGVGVSLLKRFCDRKISLEKNCSISKSNLYSLFIHKFCTKSHTHTHTHIHRHTHIYIYIYTYYICMYMCMQVCVYIYIYICVCVCVCVYVYIFYLYSSLPV